MPSKSERTGDVEERNGKKQDSLRIIRAGGWRHVLASSEDHPAVRDAQSEQVREEHAMGGEHSLWEASRAARKEDRRIVLRLERDFGHFCSLRVLA